MVIFNPASGELEEDLDEGCCGLKGEPEPWNSSLDDGQDDEDRAYEELMLRRLGIA